MIELAIAGAAAAVWWRVWLALLSRPHVNTWWLVAWLLVAWVAWLVMFGRALGLAGVLS